MNHTKEEWYKKIELPERLKGYIDVIYEEADWRIIEEADTEGVVDTTKFSDTEIARAYARGVINKRDIEGEIKCVINRFKVRVACMIEGEKEEWYSLPKKESAALRAYMTDSEVWWQNKLKIINSGKAIMKNVIPFEQMLEAIEKVDPECYFTFRQCDCNSYKQGCTGKEGVCIKWKKGKPALNTLQDRGIAEVHTKEEAIQAFKEIEKRGYVHVLSENGMCNCCACCCINLRNKDDYPVKSIHQLYYVAYVEENNCVNCGACVPKCQFGALKSDGSNMTVDPEKCWGCGACRFACPTGALKVKKLEA